MTKLNATASTRTYSTLLGGSGDDDGWSIAVDARGNAYVTGQTESTNFPLAYPAQSTYSGGDNDAFATKLNAPNRVTRYTYDGLLRLIGAVESPGSTYAYGYDNAGNHTSVQVNGGAPATSTYDAANEITNAGYDYDDAGNLLTDGTSTFVYDALSRATSVTMGSQTRTNTYNLEDAARDEGD